MCETVNEENDLLTTYVKWTKKLGKFHQRVLVIRQDYRNMRRANEESKNIKMVEAARSKCSIENNKKDAYNCSRIQDLCPSDKRRISLLIKHLAKCTREMYEAKSDLTVSESEKRAVLEEYQIFRTHYQCEKKQLEFALYKAKTEKNTLKIHIMQTLELLKCQFLEQEKQSMIIAENVRDLLCEKIIMRDVLSRKMVEKSNLITKVQELQEFLKLEKLMYSKDLAKNFVKNKMIDKASQTTDNHLYTNCDSRKFSWNPTNGKLDLKYNQNIKTKSKNDLEEPTSDGTLMRDLFFRISNIDDNESLYLMPKLPKNFN